VRPLQRTLASRSSLFKRQKAQKVLATKRHKKHKSRKQKGKKHKAESHKQEAQSRKPQAESNQKHKAGSIKEKKEDGLAR
jgi:hypothetical protein